MLVGAYVGAIVAAEVLFAFVGVVPGVAVHALVIGVAAHHLLLVRPPSGSDESDLRHAPLVVLPLVPVLRMLSVTMPVDAVSERNAYVLVGAPLLVAAVVAARVVGVRRLQARVLRWRARVDIPVAATGLPLGLVAFLVARPDAVRTGGAAGAFVAAVVLAVFVAATEELVFRGVIQGALVPVFGRFAFLVSAALAAAVYLGVRPLSFAALMAGVGLAFGWLVARYRALAGVTAAHILLTLGSLLVWPAVLR